MPFVTKQSKLPNNYPHTFRKFKTVPFLQFIVGNIELKIDLDFDFLTESAMAIKTDCNQ